MTRFGITKVVGVIDRQLGTAFKAANTPLVATEVFVAYRPDIVIIDMVMPRKDGVDVLPDATPAGGSSLNTPSIPNSTRTKCWCHRLSVEVEVDVAGSEFAQSTDQVGQRPAQATADHAATM
jgi:hypothetical protein